MGQLQTSLLNGLLIMTYQYTGDVVLRKPEFSRRTVCTRELEVKWERQMIALASAVKGVSDSADWNADGNRLKNMRYHGK